MDVTLLDISLAGCLVRSRRPLMPGAVLDLHTHLDGRPFRVKARVAEVAVDGATLGQGPLLGCLAGLQFLGLPADEEQRLRRFLTSASATQGFSATQTTR